MDFYLEIIIDKGTLHIKRHTYKHNFASVIDIKIKRQLGPPIQDSLLMLKVSMGRWQGCGTVKNFDFKPIDVNVVNKMMKKLKKSSAECCQSLSNNYPMRH